MAILAESIHVSPGERLTCNVPCRFRDIGEHEAGTRQRGKERVGHKYKLASEPPFLRPDGSQHSGHDV